MPAFDTTTATWNAADYAANSAVQQTWARELIARLKLQGTEKILDVGCGDGKVTAELAQAVPQGLTIGTDASEEMIAFAEKNFPQRTNPNLQFQIGDARNINPKNFPLSELFDLIFSNAALHWVDDHEKFLRGAASVLKPAGRLVVSCGGKGNAQDVFLALRPEMRMRRWRQYFRRIPAPYFFHSPADYEKWLPKYGFQINSLKLTPKNAIYLGPQGFATWLRSTWIPYIQRIPSESREEFIAAVTSRYVTKHPPDARNQVRVRMVRLEIDAIKV